MPQPSLQQWSVDYLSYLGAKPVVASSPRVKFLERWAKLEGTYDRGNANNPLDTMFAVRGERAYNRYGVKSYPTLSAGYKATLATMQQRFDHPILAALRDPRSSFATLALALAESNWSGFGGESWAEQFYAAEVDQVSMSSFHLPLPTVSVRGRLVDQHGRGLANVCVRTVSATAPSKSVVTSSNGTFILADLQRAAYRLRLVDCRHVAGRALPVYYDARSVPLHTTRVFSRATVLSARCAGITECPSQHLTLRAATRFGIVSPQLFWAPLARISYGTALSPTELDARSPVRGTYIYSPAPGSVLGAGLHTIRVTFRPQDILAYSPRTLTAHVQVSQAIPPVFWPTPAEITEGTPLSAAQLDATSSIRGTYTYSPALRTILKPGTHILTVAFRPNNLADFRQATQRVVLVVTPSAPTEATTAPAGGTGTATVPAGGTGTATVPAEGTGTATAPAEGTGSATAPPGATETTTVAAGGTPNAS